MKYYGINNNGVEELHRVGNVPSFTKAGRPVLSDAEIGFRLYNKTTQQYNTWNGVCWVLDNGFPDMAYSLPVTDFQLGKYISTSQGVGNTCPMVSGSSSSQDCLKIEVAANTIIRIEGVGASSGRLWAFVNKETSKIISVAAANSSALSNAEIVYLKAPQDCFLVCNLYNASAQPPYGNAKHTPYDVRLYKDASFEDTNEVTGYGYIRTNDKGLQVIFDGAMWICGDEYPDVLRCGETTDRPTLPTGKYIGFQYFDKTLGKPTYWDGTQWIDGTGVPIASSLKVLSISQTDYDALVTKDSGTLYVITP